MRFISFAFSFIAVLVLSFAASAQTFSNSAAITIPGSGTATPYPSTINVSGVTGTVSKVTVTLNGVGHTYPEDIGVLLVGPTGVKVRLMTDVGGGTGGAGGGAISGVNITFDDAAPNFLPDGGAGSPPITSGSYKPTQGTITGGGQGPLHPTDFPAPAPASPYALTLSSFNSVNANGVWSLYVDDDAAGDSGSIAGGWSITLTAGGGGGSAGKLFDFTGSGRTSFVTLTRPLNGLIRWNIAGNPASPAPNQAFIRSIDFGRVGDGETFGDSVVPNDFLGDQKTELAVYRDTDSTFYVAETPLGSGGPTLSRALPFGNSATDVPGADGDYNGDGKADFTVVRVANSQLTWYMVLSGTNTLRQVRFGDRVGLETNDTSPDTIFPGADFTGDGRDELIYVRRNAATPNLPTYYIGDAVTGSVVAVYNWGNYSSDYSLAPDDYTGDGRADLVAVRQATGGKQWYIYNPANNTSSVTVFGRSDTQTAALDYQIRGDYDGDGRQDIAVWRISDRTFYWINSSNGSLQGQFFGSVGDIPLAAFASF